MSSPGCAPQSAGTQHVANHKGRKHPSYSLRATVPAVPAVPAPKHVETALKALAPAVRPPGLRAGMAAVTRRLLGVWGPALEGGGEGLG